MFKNRTIPLFLKITLILLSFYLTSSCSHAPSKHAEINLQKNQLTKFDMVGLTVSSAELDVIYSRDNITGIGILIFPFSIIGGLTEMVVESGIRSSKDKDIVSEVNKSIGKNYFENLLEDYFLEHMRKANLFKVNHEHLDTYKALKIRGYNAIITLNIEELSLRRVPKTDKLNVCVRVLGKMIDLSQERIIWEKLEVATSDEEYTLDECKAKGERLKTSIDKIIRKIAFRLASDIIYSK